MKIGYAKAKSNLLEKYKSSYFWQGLPYTQKWTLNTLRFVILHVGHDASFQK